MYAARQQCRLLLLLLLLADGDGATEAARRNGSDIFRMIILTG